MRRVKINRVRYNGLHWAIAFLITALIVFLVTLTAEEGEEKPAEEEKRIVREITLSGGESHIVHFGEFTSPEEARIACARYMNRGAAGYLISVNGGYFAAGNLYDSAEEAEEMAESIRKGGVSCAVMRLRAEDVVLRITGTEEGIRALVDAYETCVRAEKELMMLSGRLDAGEISLPDALVVLSVTGYDVRKAHSGTESLKGKSGLMSKMMEMFSGARDSVEKISENAGGEMLLSARVKHAAIGMRMKRYSFLNGL